MYIYLCVYKYMKGHKFSNIHKTRSHALSCAHKPAAVTYGGLWKVKAFQDRRIASLLADIAPLFTLFRMPGSRAISASATL